MELKEIQQVGRLSNRGDNFVFEYNKSSKTELSDVYKSWSTDKQNAYDSCKEAMRALNGHDFKILNGNTYTFTCAYLVEEMTQRDTVAKVWLVVETKSNTYRVLYADFVKDYKKE